MKWQNSFNSFHFDDHGILHKQVNPVAGIYFDTVIYDRQEHFGLHGDAAGIQFVLETFLIGTLEKPGSKRRMDPHCGSDYGSSYDII